MRYLKKGLGAASILFISLFSLLFIISPISSVSSASLLNIIVEPSNNLFSLESHYVIGFTTGTTGTIKTVLLTFPAGFNIANAKLIEASGISPGIISVSGQTITYTVNSAVSVPSGTNIMIMLGKIVNNAVASNTVTITTKDASAGTIDGPTISPTFTLRNVASSMIGNNAIITSKIANGAVTNPKISNNSINGTQIIDGSITSADLASGSVTSVCPKSNVQHWDKIVFKPLLKIVTDPSTGISHYFYFVMNSTDPTQPIIVPGLFAPLFSGVNSPFVPSFHYDIKVLDDPTKVANNNQVVADFLNNHGYTTKFYLDGRSSSTPRQVLPTDIETVNIDYAIICAGP